MAAFCVSVELQFPDPEFSPFVGLMFCSAKRAKPANLYWLTLSKIISREVEYRFDNYFSLVGSDPPRTRQFLYQHSFRQLVHPILEQAIVCSESI